MNEDCIGLIPAAGKGVRLGLPYPKELYPVIQDNSYKPVAQFVLDNITSVGLEHVVFVVTEAKHQLMGYFGSGQRFGCNISYAVQEGPGSAGASTSPGLAHALDSAYHLTRGKTVFFGMADTIMQPRDVFQRTYDGAPTDADVILGLFPTEHSEKFGMVATNEAGNVIRVVDKPKQTALTHMWGCIIWRWRFTEHLHVKVENGVSDFAQIVNSAIERQMRVHAVTMPAGSYFDLGTYDEIMEMDRHFRRQNAAADEPAAPLPVSALAPSAQPSDSPPAKTPVIQPSRSPLVRPSGLLPDMSVVLVCWNNLVYLKDCLKSLYGANLRATFEVVVVDNGSTDGSQAMLREEFPDVAIVQNDRNVGLAKASNQGIEATSGRYVLLLNNDTVVDQGSLDGMVTFLEANPDAGAAGGRLINADGSFQSGFAAFSTLTEEFLIATGLGDALWQGYPAHEDSDETRQVAWLSSACLLIRRAALDQVGMLDEEYFIYGDEVDLQYRLQKAGWPVYFLPNVQTLHYGGRSMTRWKRRKMVYRGKLLFYKKNYGPVKTLGLRAMFSMLSMAKFGLWCAAYLVPSQRDRAQRELDSNWDVIKLCFRVA